MRRRQNSAQTFEKTKKKLFDAHETDLEHVHKEFPYGRAAAGRHRMAKAALNIWPRGNFM